MSKIYWIIMLLILIVIVVTAITIFLFINKIKKERKNKIEEYLEVVNDHWIEKLSNTINQVSIISKNTRKYKDEEIKIYNIFKKMEIRIKKLEIYIKNQLAEEKKMSKKDFTAAKRLIETNLEILDNQEKNIMNVSDHILENKKLLERKMSQYVQFRKPAIDEYRRKRNLYESVWSNLDNLNNANKVHMHNFYDFINSGKYRDALENLQAYIEGTKKFIEAIDEVPNIHNYISVILKNKITKLIKEYEEKKQVNLTHLNLKNNIKDISLVYAKARAALINLELAKAKELIIILLKKLDYLEESINYEIDSSNFINQKYKFAKKIFTETKRQYDLLNNTIKKLSEKGTNFDYDFEDLNQELEQLMKNYLSDIKTLSEIPINEIPASSMLLRIKNLLVKSKVIKEKINKELSLLWGYNINEIRFKNKMYKNGSAINSLIYELKTKKIILSEEEKNFLTTTDEDFHELLQNMDLKKNQKEFIEKINNIEKRIKQLFEVIGAKIQMSTIIKNLLKKLSKERIIDTKVNYSLLTSEQLFMDGKYTKSLNEIISLFEKRRK